MNAFQKIKLNGLKKKLQKFFEQRSAGKTVVDAEEAKTQMELGEFYDEHVFDEDLPRSDILALECYRRAAHLGNAEAQFITGKRFLDKARFWIRFSRDLYVHSVHAEYARSYYQEAFQYLQMAEEQNHALAKRLHGLAYLKAWGVSKDMEKGFQLIVDSIEAEKAWDKAPQIFKDLGLNSPEFFTLLISQRQGGGNLNIDVSKLQVDDDD